MRYIVDERTGCIAVVDTLHPEYPSGNGLHFDYAEVVAYWDKQDDAAKGSAGANRNARLYAGTLCGRLNTDRVSAKIEWRKAPCGPDDTGR